MKFIQSRVNKKPKSIIPKVILVVIVVFLFNSIYKDFFQNVGDDPENYGVISVEDGESLKSIAEKLEDEKLIKSKYFFLQYLAKKDLDTQIKSGVFRIPKPNNIPSIAHQLVFEQTSELRITIPEGYKITQIADKLIELELINSRSEFCIERNCIEHSVNDYIPEGKSLEGFIFPDTYFISSKNFTVQDLLKKSLDNFIFKLPENWESKISQTPAKNLYEIITMASIIEREVLSDEDKKLVSGILWKRYENDWTIGADATLLYEKEDNSITSADLQSNSPYNTRKFTGLPPTPISNPGLASIEAALNPTTSDYWFYLTTLDTGEVIYAKTNEEHNLNKQKHL